MARQRIKYKLAGRYMNKSDTVAYGVLSEDGQERRLTEEQLAFLVGREQIINVTAQLYKDRVIFRGKDCSISEMPVIQVNKQYNELLKNKQNNINTLLLTIPFIFNMNKLQNRIKILVIVFKIIIKNF